MVVVTFCVMPVSRSRVILGSSYTVTEFWEGLNALRGGGDREGDDYGLPSYDVGFTDPFGNSLRSLGGSWRHP
jgi:hypothetical protein